MIVAHRAQIDHVTAKMGMISARIDKAKLDLEPFYTRLRVLEDKRVSLSSGLARLKYLRDEHEHS
jgi:hypothetical protein